MVFRTSDRISRVLGVLGVALLAACTSAPPLKEQAVSKALAPMPEAERQVGFQVVNLRNGKEEVRTLVEQTAETQTWQDSSGCRAVVLRTGFAPPLQFSNCDGGTGTQTVTLVRGKAYPLAVGNQWVYAYSGTNSQGNRWSGQRSCAVEGTARIRAGAAEHDAYRVVCTDQNETVRTTLTYYVSPELQSAVFTERYRVRNWAGAPPPDSTTWELVRQQ